MRRNSEKESEGQVRGKINRSQGEIIRVRRPSRKSVHNILQYVLTIDLALKTYVVLSRGGLQKENLTKDYLKRFAQWAKDVSQDEIRLGNRLQPNGKIGVW